MKRMETAPSKPGGSAAGPGLAKAAWDLGWAMIARPARAAQKLRTDPDIVAAALALFLLHMAVSIAFYSWKPTEFAMGQDPLQMVREPLPQSPIFWARVHAWDPILTGILLYFLAWLTGCLKGGRLPIRMMLGSLVWVVPLIAHVFWSGGLIPKWGLLLAWVAALAPTIPTLKARPPESWRPLAAFCLAIVAVNLAMCPVFTVAVLLRHEGLYKALELVVLAWTLGLGSYLISSLEELPTARAFAALLFALVAQMLAVFALRAGGFVSHEVLMALMSV